MKQESLPVGGIENRVSALENTKITGDGVSIIKHDEFTTRDGSVSKIFQETNTNFLINGYVTVTIIDSQIIVRVQGISSKTSADWVVYGPPTYSPYRKVTFKYFLGEAEYLGDVSSYDDPSPGRIRFLTLNNTDQLNATIIYNKW